MASRVNDADPARFHLIGLKGELVAQLRFDWAVSLVFENGYVLRIEAPFVLHREGGSPQLIDPAAAPELLTPALSLSRRIVHEAEATIGGDLRIVFEEKLELLVGISLEYEAWVLSGPHGVELVSLPGGEIARWASPES